MAEAAYYIEPDIELPGQVCIPEEDDEDQDSSPLQRPPGSAGSVHSTGSRDTSPLQRPPGSAGSVHSTGSRDTSPLQRPPGSAGSAHSAGSAGSGKRVAVTSLSGSSSEGETSDFEDQIPPSPCSSTSSGPIYVRPPGFKHHGQEVQIFTVKHKPSVKLKKKVRRQPLDMSDYNFTTSVVKKEEICDSRTTNVQQTQQPQQPQTKNSPRGSGVMSKLGITGTKPKVRKDPLPMKLRALPQSFWQQPNAVNSASPGSMYAVLPPLCKADQAQDITEVRPVTPPSESEEIKEKDSSSSSTSSPRESMSPRESSSPREKQQSDCNNNNNNKGGTTTVAGGKEMCQDVRKKHPRPPPRIVKVSPANTDLLCKLFDGVEASDKKKPNTMRRGRPKREPNHSHSKHLIGDDPYMVDALPVLSLETTSRQTNAPSSHLSVVSVKSGGRTFTLPSLSVEQNYPAMLTEVVKAL